MAFADSLQSLKEIDLSDLDVENIGTWPLAVKAFVWTLALGLIEHLNSHHHPASVARH